MVAPFPNIVRNVAFLKENADGSVDETVFATGLKQSDLLMLCFELDDGTLRRIDTLEPWEPGALWRKVATQSVREVTTCTS
jgi:hypothetical protein